MLGSGSAQPAKSPLSNQVQPQSAAKLGPALADQNLAQAEPYPIIEAEPSLYPTSTINYSSLRDQVDIARSKSSPNKAAEVGVRQERSWLGRRGGTCMTSHRVKIFGWSAPAVPPKPAGLTVGFEPTIPRSRIPKSPGPKCPTRKNWAEPITWYTESAGNRHDLVACEHRFQQGDSRVLIWPGGDPALT